jgi:hypothetical protein
MIGHSNRESDNFSSKYLAINSSSKYVNDQHVYNDKKIGSSSSSRSPPQPELQHDPTTGLNLRDKSGLSFQSWCALSDQQVMHHCLRKNIFMPNQQGMASPNGAT